MDAEMKARFSRLFESMTDGFTGMQKRILLKIYVELVEAEFGIPERLWSEEDRGKAKRIAELRKRFKKINDANTKLLKIKSIFASKFEKDLREDLDDNPEEREY